MSTVIPAGKYLSVSKYAKKFGITKAGVYSAIKSNRLQAYSIDGIYIIPENAIIKNSRERTGYLVGISELKRGDIEGFKRKRGI